MANAKRAAEPSLVPSYAIVSRFGWWAGFGDAGDLNRGWVGPFQCVLFDSPRAAMVEVEEIRRVVGDFLAVQLVTVISDRRDLCKRN